MRNVGKIGKWNSMNHKIQFVGKVKEEIIHNLSYAASIFLIPKPSKNITIKGKAHSPLSIWNMKTDKQRGSLLGWWPKDRALW